MTTPATAPASDLERRLAQPKRRERPALVAYLTAGFPSPEAFPDLLRRVARVADAVEIGVPFTDPMADGVTIQRTSREALRQGVRLTGILQQLESSGRLEAPVLLMSYLNPLLAYGLDRLVSQAARSGVTGFIVPDLPLEECESLKALTDNEGMALVQLVSPVTPPARLATLCRVSRGFVYAVTTTGITGGAGERDTVGIGAYLDRVREQSTIPVCAGFGIRTASQIDSLAQHVDGVIVGSALLEAIERGEDPVRFLEGLRDDG